MLAAGGQERHPHVPGAQDDGIPDRRSAQLHDVHRMPSKREEERPRHRHPTHQLPPPATNPKPQYSFFQVFGFGPHRPPLVFFFWGGGFVYPGLLCVCVSGGRVLLRHLGTQTRTILGRMDANGTETHTTEVCRPAKHEKARLHLRSPKRQPLVPATTGYPDLQLTRGPPGFFFLSPLFFLLCADWGDFPEGSDCGSRRTRHVPG